MGKTRELEDFEVNILSEKISETDPSHLYPEQRKVWSDISKQILNQPVVYLSEKQRAVIHKAWWRSQNTSRKLQSPSHYDANEIFDVIANPVKRF
jgi:hypothetical protein